VSCGRIKPCGHLIRETRRRGFNLPQHNEYIALINTIAESTKKRTLGAFFKPPPKKARVSETGDQRESGESFEEHVSSTSLNCSIAETDYSEQLEFSRHSTYPFPIPQLPKSFSTELISLPSTIGRAINDPPYLDLLYFEPYFPRYLERQVFRFLRNELPFHRVEYKIKRGGIETNIRTPR
jgi:hypothetical protein